MIKHVCLFQCHHGLLYTLQCDAPFPDWQTSLGRPLDLVVYESKTCTNTAGDILGFMCWSFALTANSSNYASVQIVTTVYYHYYVIIRQTFQFNYAQLSFCSEEWLTNQSTSASCDFAISTSVLAAGCTTSSSFIIVAPSFDIDALPVFAKHAL